MRTSTNNDDWRSKYFDALSSLEGAQERFKATDAAFKRLAGRLCVAAGGQSLRLDSELKKLQAVLRRDSTSEELDKLASALTDAINALDAVPSDNTGQASPSSSIAAAEAEPELQRTGVDNPHVRAALATLLIELKRDTELGAQVEALDAKLAEPLAMEELPAVLSTLTALVQQRIQRIENTKQEMETLLSQMAERLDDISQYMTDQHQTRSESQASSETLNTQLLGEMQAMGESVEAAVDINQIRTQVRGRLDSIGHHLQAFRERETALMTQMRVRTELMQGRVVQLEREAKRLQTQLKDEQRLSLIDALTKIPNRLAYEKRIEEELKRCERFGQPCCLAVWDVDHFKSVNDTYGHRAGDRVLQAVAEWLSKHIRATDFLARYGGEEFVMLLSGTSLDQAVEFINELRNGLAKIRFNSRGNSTSITISCGVTPLNKNEPATAAFERADQALYRAKQAGRNRCEVG